MKEVIMQVQSFSVDYPKASIYVGDLVRCKDCRYWYKKMNKCNRCPSISGNWGANDFCSWGERREKSEVKE
jgi:predicted Zn-ribbon and HTH transcriptional regulator